MTPPQKRARPKRAVDKHSKQEHPWSAAFALALVALFLAMLALFAVAVGGACGNGNASTLRPQPTATPERTRDGAAGSPTPRPSPTGNGATSTPTAIPDGSDDPSPQVACGDILAPLDKQHRLTRDCEPPDLERLPGSAVWGGEQLLRREARAALLEMLAAADRDGYRIFATSSYRSYDQQLATFQQNVASGGIAYAERTSARAGHSEHQLGTTTDLTTERGGASLEAFIGTPEAAWVAANSWRYGFIVSYPEGKEPVTGYAYEPWHVRFVGKDVAKRVRDSGLTLHEFLLR